MSQPPMVRFLEKNRPSKNEWRHVLQPGLDLPDLGHPNRAQLETVVLRARRQ